MNVSSFVLLLWLCSFPSILAVVGKQSATLDDYEVDTDEAKPTSQPRVPILGRIQILSADPTQFSCLARSITNPAVQYLVVAPCSYDPLQIFVYNSEAGSLKSQGSDNVWGAVTTMPAALAADYTSAGMPLVLSDGSGLNKLWSLPLGEFGSVYVNQTKDDTAFSCLALNTEGTSTLVYSVPILRTESAQCASFRFMTAKEDINPGRILWLDDRSEAINHCVTYDATAQPPKSALYVAKCDDARQDQRFLYNFVSLHLHAMSGNKPGLFFWWRGPIKSYPTLANDDIGYGWNIPAQRQGSVLAEDDRAYSGFCWQVRVDGRIEANQTCNLFLFKPDKGSFFDLIGVNRARKHVSVVWQVNVAGKMMCVNGKPRARGETGTVWFAVVEPCEFTQYKLEQKFTLSLTSTSACTTTKCLGHIRWLGDISTSLVLPKFWYRKKNRFEPPHHAFRLFFAQIDESEVSWQYDLPFSKAGPIRINDQGQKPACLQVVDMQLEATIDMSKCAEFNLSPARNFGPDSDNGPVTVLDRFDSRAQALVALNESPSTTALRKKIRRLDVSQDLTPQDATDFKKQFDVFHADLGFSGSNLFSPVGRGVQLRPSGELVANTRYGSRGGISLPLDNLDLISSSRYLLADVYFRAQTKVIERRHSSHSFMLMSFGRASGCVVYITFKGRIGFKCYVQGKAKMRARVLNWPSASFSLLDGNLHKVSLIYSPHKSDKIALYVDGVQVLTETAVTASIYGFSRYFTMFYDEFFWQYHPLPAILYRASVTVSSSWSDITNHAARLVLRKVASLPGSISSLQQVGRLTTEWRNCTFKKAADNILFESMTCTLVPVQGGVPVAIPIDVFSLGCSRPHCDIRFVNATTLASAYQFIYKPMFPKQFMSEIVGNPSLFIDPSFLTDGFKTRVVSFGLRYKTDRALLEVDKTDQCQYMSVQSCCATVIELGANAQDEIF
eukprot:TRINITY_DN465_c0_g1_i3.p1 TRINITY_DN465_c0_g1~~TRINITY_DN465_c0_g1_i3.p1  ORF type:complete len:983 (+),score=211.09 TRINITY_DN465_c0_g1_i3:91-2949(+)